MMVVLASGQPVSKFASECFLKPVSCYSQHSVWAALATDSATATWREKAACGRLNIGRKEGKGLAR